MFLQWNTLYSVPVTKLSFLSAPPYLNVNFKNWKTRHFVDSSLFVSYFGAKEKKKLPKEVFVEGVKNFSMALVSVAGSIFVVVGTDGP